MLGDAVNIMFLQPIWAVLGITILFAVTNLTALAVAVLMKTVWVAHEQRRRRRYQALLSPVPKEWRAVYDETPLFGVTARELGFTPEGAFPEEIDWCEKPFWDDLSIPARLARHRVEQTGNVCGPDLLGARRLKRGQWLRYAAKLVPFARVRDEVVPDRILVCPGDHLVGIRVPIEPVASPTGNGSKGLAETSGGAGCGAGSGADEDGAAEQEAATDQEGLAHGQRLPS